MPFCGREFAPDVYRPGVITLSRLIWGSVGAGLLLAIIAYLSNLTGIAVLFPPLAATCFIVTTCSYLRVARPKPVIVGHFVASICGLAGVWTGAFFAGGTEYLVAAKLGFAVMFAAAGMQLFDADHPPAAATAAIPCILDLPMPGYLLPIYMAWGATIAVLFSFVWNRVWFEFPAKDIDNTEKEYGLYMGIPQIIGVIMCTLGFVAMSLIQQSFTLYNVGITAMMAGIALMAGHHFFELESMEESSG